MRWLIVCLTVITLFSCRTSKEMGSIEKITFGSGGGITGEVKTKTIDNKGNVYQDNSFIYGFDQPTTDSLFAVMASLKNDTLNAPYNIYNFIQFTDSGVTYKYVWSNKSTVPEALSSWFTYMMKTTQTTSNQ